MGQHLRGRLSAEGLLAQALPAQSSDWALFLDVDAALPDLSAAPGEEIATRRLGRALALLHRSLDGAVALLTGRSLAELDGLFAPVELPAAGQHGAELRLVAGGDIMRWPRSPRLQTIRDRLEVFALTRPGVLVEDKGRSLVTHCRGATRHSPALGSAVKDAVAGSEDLEVVALRDGFDIKPRGSDEGIAVEWLMRTPAFRGRQPIFVGDDRADLCALRAVKAFGGRAVRVRGRGKGGVRARPVVPGDVRQWLVETAAALTGQRRENQRSQGRPRC
jgi:trehalose 6-phosphate phosphatase